MAKARFRTKYNDIIHPTNNQRFTNVAAGIEADPEDDWIKYQVSSGVLVDVTPVEQPKPKAKAAAKKSAE